MVTFPCPDCGGQGCEPCNATGMIDITQCPFEWIDDDVWEAMEFADLYEKGLPPIAGGALDQAAVFVDACRFIWQEEAVWKRELGIIG